jgi:hypothetical protein
MATGIESIARRFLPVVAVATLALFCVSQATASTVVMLDDRDLAHAARAILTGVVVALDVSPDDQAVSMYVSVDVERVFKGEVTGTRVVLKQLGGLLAGHSQRVYGAPAFIVGDEVLLYLDSDRDGALHVAHLFQGHFAITREADTGARVVERASVTNRSPGSHPSGSTAPRSSSARASIRVRRPTECSTSPAATRAGRAATGSRGASSSSRPSASTISSARFSTRIGGRPSSATCAGPPSRTGSCRFAKAAESRQQMRRPGSGIAGLHPTTSRNVIYGV